MEEDEHRHKRVDGGESDLFGAGNPAVARNAIRTNIAVAALTLLVFFSFGAFALLGEYTAGVTRTKHHIRGTTAVFGEHVRITVTNLEAILFAVADRSRLTDPDSAEFTNFLRLMKSESPTLRGLYVTTADGVIRNDSEKNDVWRPIDVSDRVYFRVHAEQTGADIYFGHPKRSRRNREWFIPISVEITGPGGSFAGVAVASVDPLYFMNLFRSLAIGPVEAANIFYNDGTLMARYPQDKNRIGTSFAGMGIFQDQMQQTDQGIYVGRSPMDACKRIAAYRTVHPYPLVVVMCVRYEQALKSFYRNLWFWAAITCLAMVGITSATVYQIRQTRRLSRYSALLEDVVNDLHESREKLVRQEKLAVLGQLAGGVGHELRNPLGVISNAVYFLEMTHPETDETTKEYFGIIRRETGKAEKIIGDLLDYARVKSLNREAVDVSELLRDTLAKNQLPDSIRVHLETDPDLPPIFVDPIKIEQVLLNLITNARQAMKNEGDLSIKVQKKGSGMVGLEITDNGEGIAEAELTKIFEPLFTTKAKGIGLGLAVSKNLVESNGGQIQVVSRRGEGTTFLVSLPASNNEEKETAQ